MWLQDARASHVSRNRVMSLGRLWLARIACLYKHLHWKPGQLEIEALPRGEKRKELERGIPVSSKDSISVSGKCYFRFTP